MSTATTRARGLLAADPCREWGCDIPSQCCDQTKPLLAVAIKLAGALENQGRHLPVELTTCAGCKALAAWESHMEKTES